MGYGTALEMDGTAVAALSSINGPSASANVADALYLDSPGGAREKIATDLDYGEVSVEGGLIPKAGEGQIELLAKMKSREESDFVITYPADVGLEVSFSGFVTAFEITSQADDVINFSATITLSGEAEYDNSPAAT
jgi:hypothetical protein